MTISINRNRIIMIADLEVPVYGGELVLLFSGSGKQLIVQRS